MYLTGFHIDGFGIYHDQGVQDLPPGLVLFVGDNESGKTTLMNFCAPCSSAFPGEPLSATITTRCAAATTAAASRWSCTTAGAIPSSGPDATRPS